jgi:hypothetical protein
MIDPVTRAPNVLQFHGDSPQHQFGVVELLLAADLMTMSVTTGSKRDDG